MNLEQEDTRAKAGWKQRSIYFSGDLNAKIDTWLNTHPHAKISHLVREALFQYFKMDTCENVDFANNSNCP